MSMEENIDILAIGAHPDDVEIGMGGTIAKYKKAGKTIRIVHLTRAELSSNGTIAERQRESHRACETLGIPAPTQFQFPDRELLTYRQEAIAALVEVIRKYRPKLLFAPNNQDRHPDHGHCSEITKEAFFSAGIKKYLQESTYDAYRPDALYLYQINGIVTPDFIIDISSEIDTKFAALSCFKSQFSSSINQVETPLNNGFLERLKQRDHLIGSEAGVSYAEGFMTNKPLLVRDIIGD